jgi:Na+/H+ antiporter NhaC
VTRWVGPLLGLLAAVVLLAPAPDPGELVRQIVGRSLAKDANDDGPLFRALAERAVDGAFALDAPEALRAPFDSALNVFNAKRDTPLRVAPAAAARLALSLEGGATLDARIGDGRVVLPGVLPARGALLAPLVAIVIALSFRSTVLALYCGVFVGAVWLRLETGQSWWLSVAAGAWDVPAVHLRRELLDSFRIELIGFTFALIAMVGVMIRSAGVQGFVEWLVRFASTARSTLLVSFGMGLSIFFDDYSNCLIVGNTMRPLTDRLRIPREKLAYVVDSTAAPVAGLSMFSTWVVFEVSTYSAQLPAVGITESPYAVFLQTLPFRFYCVFSLVFVLLNLWTRRDFGPMRGAEARAALHGEVVRPGGMPLLSARMTGLEAEPGLVPRARNALLPIATVIAVTVEEIFRAGGGFAILAEDPARLWSVEGMTGVLFEGGGAGPLLTAASCGWLVVAFLAGSRVVRLAIACGAGITALAAAPLAAISPLAPKLQVGLLFASAALLSGGLLSLAGLRTPRPCLAWGEIARASFASVRALLFAIVILFGAWMIGAVCEQARTAEYLVALTSGLVTPLLLPVLLFGAACLVSFSTGTSWGTMAILLPNVVALAAAVGADHPIGSFGMVTVCIGAVLEGSIFGDHCSPISDTTVLSSVATASDHMDHVRTQAPYALCVAGIAVFAGYLPTLAFGFWSFPLALSCAVAASLALLYGFGRSLPEAA